MKNTNHMNIAMLGHKRIPSREGGIEIVVEELGIRMVSRGNRVLCCGCQNCLGNIVLQLSMVLK